MRHLSPVILLSSLCFGTAAAQTAPPTIDALVASVVATHPELKLYEAELDVARAEGRAAQAWADPELAVSFGRKSTREAEAGVSRDGAAWSVSLAQTLEWPGRVTLRKAVADRDLALADLALQGYRAELGARVRSLAFGLLAAREKAGAAQEVATRFSELKETFLARESGGLTPQLEIRVIEAQELVLQRRATAAQLEIDAALIALNHLRGAPSEAPLELAGRDIEFSDTPAVDAMLARALERNVAFRVRVVELERQGIQVRLARHEGKPALTLAPYFEEERAGEVERTVGVGLSMPLPVGRRAASLGHAAEARRSQAEAALASARLELDREVVTACHAFRIHREDLDRWPSASIAAFREAAVLADRHYRLGAVPVSTYVELQTGYLDAVEAVLDLKRDLLEAGLKLESLTSGAWRAVEVMP